MREATIKQWFGSRVLELGTDSVQSDLHHGPVHVTAMDLKHNSRDYLLYPVTPANASTISSRWDKLTVASDQVNSLASVDHIPEQDQTLLPTMLCQQSGAIFTPPCPGCGGNLHWTPARLNELSGNRAATLYCPDCFSSGEADDGRVFIADATDPEHERELSLSAAWYQQESSQKQLPCAGCDQREHCLADRQQFSQRLSVILDNAASVYIVSLTGQALNAWQQSVDHDIEMVVHEPSQEAIQKFKARFSLFRQWLAAMDVLQQHDLPVEFDVSLMRANIVADDLMGDAVWRSRLCWFPGIATTVNSTECSERMTFKFQQLQVSDNAVSLQGCIRVRHDIEVPDRLFVTLGISEGFINPLNFECEVFVQDADYLKFNAEIETQDPAIAASLNVLKHIPELDLDVTMTIADGSMNPRSDALQALLACFESLQASPSELMKQLTSWFAGNINSDETVTAFVNRITDAEMFVQVLNLLPFMRWLNDADESLAHSYFALLTQMVDAASSGRLLQNDYAEVEATAYIEHLMTESEAAWSELDDFSEQPATPGHLSAANPPPSASAIDKMITDILQDYIEDSGWLSRFFSSASSGRQAIERIPVSVESAPARPVMDDHISANAGLDETIILGRSAPTSGAMEISSDSASKPISSTLEEGLDETIILNQNAAQPKAVSERVMAASTQSSAPGADLEETIILHRGEK